MMVVIMSAHRRGVYKRAYFISLWKLFEQVAWEMCCPYTELIQIVSLTEVGYRPYLI